MKYKFFILFIFIFSFSLSFSPPLYAECPDGGPGSENCDLNGTSNSVTLVNPLEGGGVNSLPELIKKILDIALTLGVPLIALAIIYSGYLFVAAQGNPTKLEEAKRTLVWVIVGAAILLAAYAISTAIVSTINAIRG